MAISPSDVNPLSPEDLAIVLRWESVIDAELYNEEDRRNSGTARIKILYEEGEEIQGTYMDRFTELERRYRRAGWHVERSARDSGPALAICVNEHWKANW
ncbi:hypothetical protein HQ571_00985 [Candidatus Kuenenbacteria bacterium]|nr:hypothetical protein [Candidatus Kuenenbacteria bacterium]